MGEPFPRVSVRVPASQPATSLATHWPNKGVLWLLLNVLYCLSENVASQPLWIISELKETFMKRYIVEMTNQADIRQEGQSEKTESCWENLWNELQLRGP